MSLLLLLPSLKDSICCYHILPAKTHAVQLYLINWCNWKLLCSVSIELKYKEIMGSIHKLWALLTIGPPQWEICYTWLLFLSPGWLWIGSVMYFCISILFSLVILWISIQLSLHLLFWKILHHFWFASQKSKGPLQSKVWQQTWQLLWMNSEGLF